MIKQEYRWNYHVPAFGSWDYGDDDLPYTQCFESARSQPAFARFAAYSDTADVEDRDLYVTGDLYQNDVVTPTVILVPRRSVSFSSQTNLSFFEFLYIKINFSLAKFK